MSIIVSRWRRYRLFSIPNPESVPIPNSISLIALFCKKLGSIDHLEAITSCLVLCRCIISSPEFLSCQLVIMPMKLKVRDIANESVEEVLRWHYRQLRMLFSQCKAGGSSRLDSRFFVEYLLKLYITGLPPPSLPGRESHQRILPKFFNGKLRHN